MLVFRRVCLAATAALFLLPAAGAHAAAPTFYLSPSGNDSAACSQSAPCRTFDRGYRVASPGSEVILAAGSYGSQSLSNVPVKTVATKVVFRPATGAAVTIGGLSINNSDNIEVRDVKTSGWGITNGAAHIILRRVFAGDVEQAAGYFSGSDDVQIIDSEIARVDPNDGIHMNNGGGSNTNIVIDGLYEHDLTINRDPASHNDCIQTGDVTNLVIRNSRFVNCGTQGVFLNPYNGGATKNITIENNFFGVAQLGYNVLYVGDAVGVTVRNNSFVGQVYTYNSAAFTSLKMVNNIFAGNDSYNCGLLAQRSVTFSNNASKTSCSGATNHLVNSGLSSQFVNTSGTSAFDLHLKAGAAAIDKGTMTNGATTDYDRTGRPVGGAADIGADEYGTGGTPPPPPPPVGDTTAPNTTITSAPPNSASTTAVLVFSGTDNVTAAGALKFQCRGASGVWVSCTSPYTLTGVTVGSHTVAVRAIDAAGNIDATPASATWTTTSTGSPTPPASGLVAAYGFKETAGTTGATDSSGNGLKGTITGATRTTGKFGGGLSFNGPGNVVTVADNAKLDLTRGMTLEAWVMPTVAGGWRTLMVKQRDRGMSYAMYSNTSTGAGGYVADASAERAVRVAQTLPLNTWSHVATTYDGTTLRLFINGTQVGSLAVAGPIAVGTGALSIGGNPVWGEWFQGRMDEVRIYNRALSSTELKADMAKAI
jgi:hypothetical protein